jgi:branched-chain amino acid aminotransferase
MVKDGVVITPEGRNILRGISRAYVFELAGQLGYRCEECNIEPYDVYCADEAFMTATPFCILPVTGLNHSRIDSGAMGPVTRALLKQWSQNVGVDIEQQIKAYSAEVRDLQQGTAPTPYQFRRK